jgi:hypothetical protein
VNYVVICYPPHEKYKLNENRNQGLYYYGIPMPRKIAISRKYFTHIYEMNETGL